MGEYETAAGAARARRTSRAFRLSAVCAFTIALFAVPAAAASADTISGRAFEDPSRAGVYEAGDTPLANQQIYLYDASGDYLAEAYTAADGTYSFSGLADGSYEVAYANPSWWILWDDWVPDTTGSIFPTITVQLSGSAEADFGWRPIVRSTTLSAPVSEVVGPNGLTVESYDDVVTAQSLYNTIMTGTVGGEAPDTTVRFDWSSTSTTTTSVTETNGVYSNYQAISNVSYESWLDDGVEALGHEYGHAWARYYAYIVQQDPTLQSYLTARGLWGNPNLNTSMAWNQWELLADDYRQLLGPPAGRSYPAMNGSIPPASEVPGLASFLANVFTTPPAPVNTVAPSVTGVAGVGQTLTCNPGGWTQTPTLTYQWFRDGSAISGAAGQTYTAASADGGQTLSCTVTATDAGGFNAASAPAVTVAALALTNVAMSPTPVKTSGVASFTLSVPASVTLQVLSASGSVVTTSLSKATEPAGTPTVTWSRPRSVKAGTYTLRAVASAGGASVTASQSFSVS